MSEQHREHKKSLQSARKPRQIVTDPANSCQLQPVNELSVASADPEPALTQRQQQALVAMVSAHSIAAAARHSGVSERWIHRWLRNDKAFQSKLRQLRQRSLDQASLQMQHVASDVVAVMHELIHSGRPIESGRAALIRTALDFAYRSGTLADRIAGLEQAQKKKCPERSRGTGCRARSANRRARCLGETQEKIGDCHKRQDISSLSATSVRPRLTVPSIFSQPRRVRGQGG